MKNRDQLRLEKERERDLRIQELYQKIPELEKLDREQEALAFQIMKSAIHKNIDREQINAHYLAIEEEKRKLLENEGLDLSVYEPDWSCSICKDKGFIAPGQPCVCFKQDIMAQRYRQSGISNTYQDKTFDTFDVQFYGDEGDMADKVARSHKMADAIIQDVPIGNLLILGDVGRGKTHLALAIANAVIRGGKKVYYTRVDDLFDLLRRAQFHDEENGVAPENIDHLLYQSDLLILDDLGSEKVSDFSLNQLVRLLEKRNIEAKPWIITSNLNINDFEKRYDARFADRLFQFTSVFRIPDGMSHRGRNYPTERQKV